MERTFVLPPDAETASRRRVTLTVPYETTFEERTWPDDDSDEQVATHRYGNHAAALEGYLSRIDRLLDAGALELPPHVAYHDDDGAVVALRPPVLPELEVVRDGEPTTTTFDSLPDAVRAYNAELDALRAEGYRIVRPAFTSLYPTPDDDDYELVTVHDDAGQISKHYYRRKDDPDEEFGPEWWYRDGEVWQHDFQIHTRRQGPSVEYSSAGFRALMCWHRGRKRGPSMFSPDATDEHLQDITVYEAEIGTSQARSLALSMKGDAIDSWTETGVDANGELRGVWRVRAGQREVETHYEPPGNAVLRRIYVGDARLLRRVQRYDEQGRHHGDWLEYDAAGEQTEVRQYDHGKKIGHWRVPQDDDPGYVEYEFQQPDRYRRIAWFYENGQPEQTRVFAEDEPWPCIRIDFHREDGSLSQRRTRRDAESWLAEHFGEDGVTVERRELLDNDDNPIPDADLPPEWLRSLFACLEAGEQPPTDETAAYGATTAKRPNLAHSLEDHLARMMCIAHADGIDALAPDKASARGAWRHTSAAGSRLTIKRKKGQLDTAQLHRPDGTLAAEASFQWTERLTHAEAPVAVTLFHDDGVSVRRSGQYFAEFPWNDEETLHLARNDWWIDVEPDGVVRRAQGFGTGSTNLLAEHPYARAPTAAADDAPRSFDALLDEARRLVGGEPTRARFLELCELVERGHARDPNRTVRELVPTIHDRVAGWPSRVRQAPWLWINRLIRGELPVQALHLVAAVSISAALTGRYLSNPHYPLLVRWLRDYPADGPTIEGLSLGLDRAALASLEAARDAEPDARLHPHGNLGSDLDASFLYDSDDLPVIFGCPLLREVSVIDVSREPTRHDLYWDDQGILDGRGLTVGAILRHLPSTQLAVLDLHGQCSSPRDPTGLEQRGPWKTRAATLAALDLGGGHPLGDKALVAIAKHCPALEALSVVPGEAGAVIAGDYDFDAWDESEGRDSVYGRLVEHWHIYGNDDIDRMRATKRGWRALGKLERLERVAVGQQHDASSLSPRVEVVQLPGWEPLPRVAAWEQRFESVESRVES